MTDQTGDTPEWMKGAFGHRRRAEEAELEGLVAKFRDCVTSPREPSDKEWPTSKDYRDLMTLVSKLDPRGTDRKKHHPRWKYSVSAVDKEYSDLLIRDVIERFLLRAKGILSVHGLEDPPVTIKVLLDYMDAKSGTVRHFKTTKLAKEISNGEKQADGKHVGQLLDLCSDSFRALCSGELNSPDHIPKKWKPFVEYAAANEIMREHKEYLKHHYRWLADLGEFVSWLEHPEYGDFEQQISRLVHFWTPRELDDQREKEKNRLRKRRERERKTRGEQE